MKKLSRLLFAGALSLFLGTSVSGIQAASHDGYMAEGRFDGEGFGGGYGPYSSGGGYVDADYSNGGCFAPCNDSYGSCCDAPRNDCCSRFAFGVDYLYWDVCQPGLDVAKVTTGLSSLSSEACACSASCRSETQYFKFKPKSGYRIGLSYQLPCWDDVSLNFVFTYFHPKVNKRYHNDPANVCGTSIIQTTTDQIDIGLSPIAGCRQTEPTGFLFNTADSTVHARVKLKYELYDLVLSKNIGCDNWTATPYVGARFLWLRESLNNSIDGAFFTGGSSVTGGHGFTWKSKVPVGGITLGVHGRYAFCGPLNVIGHLGVSALGGKPKTHNNYRSFASPDCSRIRHRDRQHCRIVTGWDGSLGVGYDWNFCTCPVRLGIGYEVQDWFNLPERVRFVNNYLDTDTNPFSTLQTSDTGGRLTVHGLFVRVAFAF